ncbi:MAG: Rnf-Nqr domain containing protein [Oscillospiraceae bacterium]
MFVFSMIAIFLENSIFTRALGTSTSLFIVRKKYNILLFGAVMTCIITVSSLIVYLINPFVEQITHKYYFTPIIYVAIIGVVYIAALLITGACFKKKKKEILTMIHVSAFNCADLGALLLASEYPDLSLGGFIGFGIGTGIGFTMATYFIDIAYEKLNSEKIPSSFRGFPITLMYIGILSLAFYGLIGHELPF